MHSVKREWEVSTGSSCRNVLRFRFGAAGRMTFLYEGFVNVSSFAIFLT